MKAVILAGGKGTRLAPYTKILPKPLAPIGDLPILEILLRQIKRAGIDEAILCVGHLAHLVESFCQDGSQFGLRIHYSFEDKPLGTAGPLAQLQGLDEPFLVMNGDVLTTLDLSALAQAHQQAAKSKQAAIATIATHARQVKIDLGVVELGVQNQIIGYQEKPTYHFQVSMGIYVFEPHLLNFIPPNQYLDFPDLVLRLIAAGERVASYPFEGYWQDLGHPDDYEQAVQDFETLRAQILGPV